MVLFYKNGAQDRTSKRGRKWRACLPRSNDDRIVLVRILHGAVRHGMRKIFNAVFKLISFCHREPHLKTRIPRLGTDLEITTVLFYDALDGIEPESGSLSNSFSREERL